MAVGSFNPIISAYDAAPAPRVWPRLSTQGPPWDGPRDLGPTTVSTLDASCP